MISFYVLFSFLMSFSIFGGQAQATTIVDDGSYFIIRKTDNNSINNDNVISLVGYDSRQYFRNKFCVFINAWCVASVILFNNNNLSNGRLRSWWLTSALLFLPVVISAVAIPTAQYDALQTLLDDVGCKNSSCALHQLNASYECPESSAGVRLSCDSSGNVTFLDLESFKLDGTLSGIVGQLSMLTQLSFWSNQMTGNLKSEIGLLNNLRALELGGNRFNSTIPSEIGLLTSMVNLGISANEFVGTLPVELSKLTLMKAFSAAQNRFTGIVPPFASVAWYQRCIIFFQIKNPSLFSIKDIANSPNCMQNGGRCLCQTAIMRLCPPSITTSLLSTTTTTPSTTPFENSTLTTETDSTMAPSTTTTSDQTSSSTATNDTIATTMMTTMLPTTTSTTTTTTTHVATTSSNSSTVMTTASTLSTESPSNQTLTTTMLVMLDNSPSTTDNNNINASIIGGSIGGAAVLLIALLAVIVGFVRRRGKQSSIAIDSSEMKMDSGIGSARFNSFADSSRTSIKLSKDDSIDGKTRMFVSMNTEEASDNRAASTTSGVVDDSRRNIVSNEYRSLRTIPASELKLEGGERTAKVLGEGGFGRVLRMKWQHALVAVKEIKTDGMTEQQIEKLKDSLLREATVQASLSHDHILPIRGIVVDVPPLRIVLPLCHESLYDHIHHSQSARLSDQECMRIGFELASALHYLHTLTPTILHRDLKSHNVMLTEHMRVQLVDFGLAMLKDYVATTTVTSRNSSSNAQPKQVGTYQYMAPELFGISSHYSTSSDMWAFGVVLWEMNTYEIPFARTPPHLVENGSLILAGERLSLLDAAPPRYNQLITRCWSQSRNDRLSADDAARLLEEMARIDDIPPPMLESIKRW